MMRFSGIFALIVFAGTNFTAMHSQTAQNAKPATRAAVAGARAAGARGCPVTRPEEHPFVRPAPFPPIPGSPTAFWYGTDKLWRMLATGQWVWRPHGPGHENDLTEKIVWYRDGYIWRDFHGRPPFEVSGRRLDAEGPPMEIDGATGSGDEAGRSFMMMGAWAPTPGCWEFKGEYLGDELKFVVWVAPQ